MAFKQCSMCGKLFADRDEFLRASDTVLIGYMVDLENPERGLFLFNHVCKTTLAIPVSEFRDLYNGPKYTVRKNGGESCPRHCFDIYNTEPCPNTCAYAFVRNVMQVIRGINQQRKHAFHSARNPIEQSCEH